MKHATALALAVLAVSAQADERNQQNDATKQQAAGQFVYERNCISCHGPGRGNLGNDYRPGTDALRVKYNGTLPAVLSERRDLTPAFIEHFVRNGISVMPFFRKTEIGDEELQQLIGYLTRNNPRD